ncbi:transposase [Megamonas hypermegale]|uniref:transposase n=1 Tax=Megamonas hypermegale TaxID=158847 RepID=UPI0034E971D5
MISHSHFTIKDCIHIEIFSLFGFSTRFIAKILSRHHSTIARELSRNKSKDFYHAETAQSLYTKRRMSNFPKDKFSDIIGQIISDKITEKLSPEQIVHTVLNGIIFLKTIYKWIY